MSLITTGNMPALLKEGLYVPKPKKKPAIKSTLTKKIKTKNKGN